jgi:hypothetical protein
VLDAAGSGADLGLTMDVTYTAKALGACLEESRERGGVSLYLATLHGRSEAIERPVPQELKWLLV